MIKRRNSNRLSSRGCLFLFAITTVIMPGCKKQAPPPPQATPLPQKTVSAPPAPAKPVMANSSAAKSAIQKQLSTVKKPIPLGAVSLDFASKRDPFKPFIPAPAAPQAASAGKASKVIQRDALPIQSFDTEKFRITGIITGIKENSALVMDPNGKGYVVKEGMSIGNNDGRVRKVTASSVEVEESFRDDSGKVRKRIVKLTLLRKK
jgi:type IV pilus assembly protein PilP